MGDKSLVGDLHAMQREMRVPKERRNNFGNYNYRSCEDIVDEAKRNLDMDIVLIMSDEVVVLGDRYYIKATASLRRGDEVISAIGWARESKEQKGMAEAQITGSASSYARKYALCGLFAIDDGIDDDTTSTHGKQKETIQVQPKKDMPLRQIVDKLKVAIAAKQDYASYAEWQQKVAVEEARVKILKDPTLAAELDDFIADHFKLMKWEV